MKKLNRSSRRGIASAAIAARHSRRSRLASTLPERLEVRQLMSTYVVNTSTDPTTPAAGQLSLREAIQMADLDTTPDVIQFAMTDGTTINLAAALQPITNAVTIDGTMQAGVALSGGGSASIGLDFEAGSGGSAVKGLTIGSFSTAGIVLNANGVTVQGNQIGTDSGGTLSKGNQTGILVLSQSNQIRGNLISGNNGTGIVVNGTGNGNLIQGNTIGLDTTGMVALGNGGDGIDLIGTDSVPVSGVAVLGNVLSGNFISGMYLADATANTIQGNLIGTDAMGHETIDPTLLLPRFGNNADGITIDFGTAGNLIGGTTAAARNVISGNWGNGISVDNGGMAANLVDGNYIGADVTGQVNAGNQGDGVYIQAGGILTLGGDVTQGFANVLSGNLGYGLDIEGGITQAYGNLIGTAADGHTALGNSGDGVHINNSSGNVIGSTAAGMGNLIAFNGATAPGRGVNIISGTKNAVEGNSIFSNRSLGIDLGGDGRTLNDSVGHAGPNNYQDFPVLASVTGDGKLATVTGTMTGVAGSVYTLDFYDNANADASGYGQGQVYVGSITVTIGSDGSAASFTATFAQPLASDASFLTQWSVTATDSQGNTSEFALDAAETITLPQTQQPSTTTLGSSAEPSAWGQLVTFTATVTGGASSAPTGTVQFSIDGAPVGGPVTLVNGVATYATSALTVTSAAGHTITAEYSGDANYLTSQATIFQDVSRAASTTVLSATPLASTFGQTVTLTAAVSPTINGIVPTGSVMFLDGATLLGTVTLDANGNASLPVSTLSVGGHTITAVYSSDDNYMGSTSNAVTETVSPVGNSISGAVFRDVTGDGLSADDKTMSGVTVQLLKVSGASTSVVASVVSGSNGTYAFNNVAAGSYEVQEVTPTGFVRTAPTNSAFYTANVTSGTTITGDNFDNYMAACCCGSLSHVVYTINGCYHVTDLRGHVHQGDTVSVTFTINNGYMDTLSLVSYIAPGASFNAGTASQQKIYQDSTGTFGPGTYTLSVVIPPCYFQVDFVCGYAIDHFGPAGSNIFYSAQDRLISADNGGARSAAQAHLS